MVLGVGSTHGALRFGHHMGMRRDGADPRVHGRTPRRVQSDTDTSPRRPQTSVRHSPVLCSTQVTRTRMSPCQYGGSWLSRDTVENCLSRAEPGVQLADTLHMPV